MRVLFIDAFAPDDPDRRSADTAAELLAAAGHEIRRVDVVADGFVPYMSAAERSVYHEEGANILAEEVRYSADGVMWAEALLFCYPTRAFMVPAELKAWFERVLLPGVTFGFNARGKVVAGMTNIRRLGVVTSTPHGRWATARARDRGRRSIMWTLRLSCARTCRRTFISVRAGRDAESTIRRRLRRW
jgi:putative NADPH-quinone reductase